MWPSFKQEELEYLKKNFSMRINKSIDQFHSIPSIDLLDEEKCIKYLDSLTRILQSPSRMITASQFSKRYAFLTVAPSLYSMTMYNKKLDVSIGNCCIESANHHKSWSSYISLKDYQVKELTNKNRNEMRDEIIKTVFNEHLVKIWRSISNVANVPMSILWENTAIRVYSLYEKRISGETDENQKSRLHDDYQYLLKDASGSLFGETENPLAKFNNPKCTIATSDQSVRIRKTCCFYYKVAANGKYCSTCPKIK